DNHKESAAAQSDSDHGSCLNDNSHIKEFISMSAARGRGKENAADQSCDIQGNAAAGCQSLGSISLDQHIRLKLSESVCQQIPAHIENNNAKEKRQIFAFCISSKECGKRHLGGTLFTASPVKTLSLTMKFFELAGKGSPQKRDRCQSCQNSKYHSGPKSPFHSGHDESHRIRSQYTNLPEYLCGSHKVRGSFFIRRVMRNDGKTDGKVCPGRKSSQNQSG